MTSKAPPTPREPLVSVCVSTRNRASLLPRLIDALEQQTLSWEAFEVIVVDDGSDDDTYDVLKQLQQDSPVQLHVFRNPVSKGPATGRNVAWRAARAPYIAFTDDDCVQTPYWLEVGYRTMIEGHRIGVGRVMPNPDQMHDLGPFSYTLWVDKPSAAWFATANLFYRRDDLEAVGGFDERYRAAAGEDTDLGLRIAEECGAQVYFMRAALVYHDVRRSDFWTKIRDQGRWSDIPGIFARHPDARGRALYGGVFWRRTHLQALMFVAGLAAAGKVKWSPLLSIWWLHERTCRQPLCEGPRRRWAVLPGALAMDLVEVGQMVRGSVRHRTFML